MRELIEHFKNDDIISIHKGKYNNITRMLYILLKNLVEDNVTKFEINNEMIIWKYEDNEVRRIPFGESSEEGIKHINNMLMILKNDQIVGKYVTASLQDGILVCYIKSDKC